MDIEKQSTYLVLRGLELRPVGWADANGPELSDQDYDDNSNEKCSPYGIRTSQHHP